MRGLELDPARRQRRTAAPSRSGTPSGRAAAGVLVTLAHAIAGAIAKRGLAALCIGVGQGIAMLVERA